ncbi:hypothetical protein PC119_g12619 [Phytophthora cactorum]|uniref:Uncharacterized protein n=1 Tax=Phytophthora cactorum TaxID=29920 RepID=A0A8T1DBL0_9STRA|nr:hypothetical protein PC117_g12201 [Phytophthora cactorum]KAG3013174.1 hypothetical protein PC119_g12619 [Phytophthora cactorum]
MTSPPLAKTHNCLPVVGNDSLPPSTCTLANGKPLTVDEFNSQSVAFNLARATFVTLCESIRQSLHRSHTGSESVKSPSECIAR